jgi:glycerophosphoryl diester phosphodiesterase
VASRPFDIQGHRGARGLAPENTLPGFELALRSGVTALELDCGLTLDGVVVISHERTLNRDITRDARGEWLEQHGPAIWALTYDDLARYDVGRIDPRSRYAQRFPRQKALDGARIPRLADLFAHVRALKHDVVRFNIETKLSPFVPAETAMPEIFVQSLLQTIRQGSMESRVTVQSFDWRTLRLVQQEAPRVPTSYLTAERTAPHNLAWRSPCLPWTAGFDVRDFGGSVPRTIKAAGGSIWSPHYGELSAAAVTEAHTLGLQVLPWTVNSEDDMRRLIGWGVDGIISDYPDVLARVAAGVTS